MKIKRAVPVNHRISTTKTVLLFTFFLCHIERHKYRVPPFQIWAIKCLFLTWVMNFLLFFTHIHLFILVHIYCHITNVSLPFTYVPPHLPSVPRTTSPRYSPKQHVAAAQLGAQTFWSYYPDMDGLQRPAPCRWTRQIQKAVFFLSMCSSWGRSWLLLPAGIYFNYPHENLYLKPWKRDSLPLRVSTAALPLTSERLWGHFIPFTWAKYIAWNLCSLQTICCVCF